MNKFFSLNFDFAGAAAATLCALHCAAFPVLLSLGLVSNTAHNHTFDWVLMSIGIIIAGYILVKDYTFNHRNFLPLLTAAIGFLVLFTGIETHGEHFYLNVIGGLMIIASHIMNWKMSH